MRILLTAAACLLLLGEIGCIIPLRSKPTAGHRHSPEALAFLRPPGTTRDEVIASLGQPLLESQETRTLLYEWEQTLRYLVSTPHVIHRKTEIRGDVFMSYADRFGLFILYDERGVIAAHEVRKIRSPTLQEAFAEWYRNRSRSP